LNQIFVVDLVYSCTLVPIESFLYNISWINQVKNGICILLDRRCENYNYPRLADVIQEVLQMRPSF